jgi:Zn-dependent alcohol dehydrogenase
MGRAGEVLLQVKTCGVCHTDLHVMKAEVPFPRPAVLGHEVAGEVVAHGPGSAAAQLDALPVGTKAVGAFIMPCMDCFFCSGGQEEMCEKFFAFNRLNGTLYDGTTRLYSADRGDPIAMYRCVA